jgi:hypothetical protein
VRSDGLTKVLVIGKVRCIERCHVQLNESLSLFFGDVEVPVNVDQMSETKFSGEAVRTAEGLNGEGGEVIDVLRLALPEKWLEQGIFEDAAVERVLKTVEYLLTTCEFVQGRHGSIVREGHPGPVVRIARRWRFRRSQTRYWWHAQHGGRKRVVAQCAALQTVEMR